MVNAWDLARSRRAAKVEVLPHQLASLPVSLPLFPRFANWQLFEGQHVWLLILCLLWVLLACLPLLVDRGQQLKGDGLQFGGLHCWRWVVCWLWELCRWVVCWLWELPLLRSIVQLIQIPELACPPVNRIFTASCRR
jgi:hypothetical protein